jgi:hypothetical protein
MRRFSAIVVVVLFALTASVVLSNRGSSRPHALDSAPPARTPTLEALGGLAEGMPLGVFRITHVSEPTDGAVWVHASGPQSGNPSQGQSEVTYEIRLVSDTPLPAAKAGPYAVYYRGADGGPEVIAAAADLARILDRGPKDREPLRGLTPYP